MPEVTSSVGLLNSMTNQTSASYIHGFSIPERTRLVKQAAVLAPAVFSTLDLSFHEKILEIGCGVGAQTKQLLHHWPHLNIHSIDLSPKHLASAADYLRDEIANNQAHLTRANAEHLPFDTGVFDSALTIWVLEHVQHPERILQEIKRVLKPCGEVILSEVDNATFRFFPENPVIHDWWDKFNAFQQAGGADPFIGQRLKELARKTGFSNIKIKPIHVVSSRREPERRLELLHYVRDLLLSGSENMKQAGYVDANDEQLLQDEFKRLESQTEIDFQYIAVRLTATKSKK